MPVFGSGSLSVGLHRARHAIRDSVSPSASWSDGGTWMIRADGLTDIPPHTAYVRPTAHCVGVYAFAGWTSAASVRPKASASAEKWPPYIRASPTHASRTSAGTPGPVDV